MLTTTITLWSCLKTYNEHYREQFDDISFQILVKNFNISDAAIIQVRNVLYEKMRNNPIQYILDCQTNTSIHLQITT